MASAAELRHVFGRDGAAVRPWPTPDSIRGCDGRGRVAPDLVAYYTARGHALRNQAIADAALRAWRWLTAGVRHEPRRPAPHRGSTLEVIRR